MKRDLKNELRALLNSHSAENASNTPDFLLAEYMLGCLEIYNITIQKRDAWRGCTDTAPGGRRVLDGGQQ